MQSAQVEMESHMHEKKGFCRHHGCLVSLTFSDGSLFCRKSVFFFFILASDNASSYRTQSILTILSIFIDIEINDTRS